MSVRDLKSSLQAMLSNYSYEENILRNAKRLIMSDITDYNIKLFMENVEFFHKMINLINRTNLKIKKSRGISFMPSCQVCKKIFTENSSEKVILYPCNHGVHKSCKGPNQSCLVCMKEENHQREKIIIYFSPYQIIIQTFLFVVVHMISKIRGKLPIFNNTKKTEEQSNSSGVQNVN